MAFFGESKRSLGIDIGTASVKLVQLAVDGNRLKLETYGEVWATKPNDEDPLPVFSLTDEEMGSMIGELVKAAKARPQNVTISVPVFSSFITLIELPALSQAELAEAIPYQARKYVPVPIEDVTLDWSISGRRTSAATDEKQPTEIFEVLLVAIPNEIVARYVKIASRAGLELKALESESFGLARGLIGSDKGLVCLVDVGASSTDITIIDEGTVRIAHNFDIAGIRLTSTIARSLSVSFARAEALKQERGLKQTVGERNISDIMLPLVDLIINEVSRFISDYAIKTNRKVTKVILSGGNARIPGMAEYFSQKLALPVTLANPFGSFIYPQQLEKRLHLIGPSYAVTIGMALRHFTQPTP